KNTTVTIKKATEEQVAKATAQLNAPKTAAQPQVAKTTVASAQELAAQAKAGTTTGNRALTEKVELPAASVAKVDTKVLKSVVAKMGGGAAGEGGAASSAAGGPGGAGGSGKGILIPESFSIQGMVMQAIDQGTMLPGMDRWQMAMLLLKLNHENRQINSTAT